MPVRPQARAAPASATGNGLCAVRLPPVPLAVAAVTGHPPNGSARGCLYALLMTLWLAAVVVAVLVVLAGRSG